MSKLPYNITPNSASVLINGRFKIVPSSANNFPALCEELRKPEHDVEEIMRLADVMNFVALKQFAGVQIGKDRVMWRGKQVKNVIAERLLTAVMEGYDPEPLSLFLDKLMQNPIKSAQDELYLWLEAGNAPISPDGDFLAFKRVRKDYKDKHTGKMDNSVGKVVEMPRSECDTNRNNHCSRGLHFCQHGYLQSFGGGRTMIVKVNPADVVSIPTDYNFQKGRAWRYEVVGEVDNDEKNTTQHFDRVIDDRYPSVEQVVRDEAKLADLFEKMSKIFHEHLGVAEDEITLQTSAEKMGADSLDVVELVMAFEERFSVEIPEERAENLVNAPLFEVRDVLYDLINEKGDRENVINEPDQFHIDVDKIKSGKETNIVDAVVAADVPMADSLNDAMIKSSFGSKKSARPIPENSAVKKTTVKKEPAKKTSKKPEVETGIEFANSAGKKFSAKYVKGLAESMSQRKAAEVLGIGKSTFADWIKKINAGK